MRLFVTPAYLKEREGLAFRATCEHCAHFDDEQELCSLTYPTQPHREGTHQALGEGDVVLFCKTFEVA